MQRVLELSTVIPVQKFGDELNSNVALKKCTRILRNTKLTTCDLFFCSGKNTGFKDRTQVYSHMGTCARLRRDGEGRLLNKATARLVQSGLAALQTTENVLLTEASATARSRGTFLDQDDTHMGGDAYPSDLQREQIDCQAMLNYERERYKQKNHHFCRRCR